MTSLAQTARGGRPAAGAGPEPGGVRRLPGRLRPPGARRLPARPAGTRWGTFDGERARGQGDGPRVRLLVPRPPGPDQRHRRRRRLGRAPRRGLLDALLAAVLERGPARAGRGHLRRSSRPRRASTGATATSSSPPTTTVEIPTARLASVPKPSRRTLRRATAADFDAVRRVYATWAAAQNGPLTRAGASFPADADAFIAAFTGVTLAESDGEVVGYRLVEPRPRLRRTPRRSRSPTSSPCTRDATLRAVAGVRVVRDRHRPRPAAHLGSRLGPPGAALPRLAGRAQPSPTCSASTTSPARSPGCALDRAGSASRVAGDLLGTTNGDWSLTPDDGVSTCVRRRSTGRPDLRPARPGPALRRRRVLRRPADGRAAHRRPIERPRPRRAPRRPPAAHPRLLLSRIASVELQLDVRPDHEDAVGPQPHPLGADRTAVAVGHERDVGVAARLAADRDGVRRTAGRAVGEACSPSRRPRPRRGPARPGRGCARR